VITARHVNPKRRSNAVAHSLTLNSPVVVFITSELLIYNTKNCVLFVCKSLTFVYIDFYKVKMMLEILFMCNVLKQSVLCLVFFHIMARQ